MLDDGFWMMAATVVFFMEIDFAYYSDGTNTWDSFVLFRGKEMLYSSWIILINSLKRQNQWLISKMLRK
jgi:hypothetical protein